MKTFFNVMHINKKSYYFLLPSYKNKKNVLKTDVTEVFQLFKKQQMK